MPDFEHYLARHGECAMQALIERLERYEGIRARNGASLHDRWNFLMNSANFRPLVAA